MAIWHELYPIGRSFGLIKSPPDVACSLLFRELQRTFGATGDEIAYVGAFTGATAAVAALDPVSFPIEDRYLILECAGDWSLYLDNSALFDASPPRLADLARVQEVDSIYVSSSLPGTDEANPIQRVSTFRAGGGLVRAVSNQRYRGAWRFDQDGQPYPFEDLASYETATDAERFTREHLRAFLSQLGVQVSWDSLLTIYDDASGYLLERRSNAPSARQVYKTVNELGRHPDLRPSEMKLT